MKISASPNIRTGEGFNEAVPSWGHLILLKIRGLIAVTWLCNFRNYLTRKHLSLREQFLQSTTNAAGRLRVRSALNPILYACMIITVPGIYMAVYSPTGAPVWLVILIFIPICVFAYVTVYFARNSPENLRSEEFHIKKQTLEIIAQKGEPFTINPLSLELIPNPKYEDAGKEPLQ